MNGRRTVVAFLVAPLVIPLSTVSIFLGAGLDRAWGMVVPYSAVAIVTAVLTVVTYVISLLVGIPTYRFLMARQMTAFRIAPLAGAFVGFVGYWLVGIARGFAGLATGSEALFTLMAALSVTLISAVAGVIFWLIARPDRQTAPESPTYDQPGGQ